MNESQKIAKTINSYLNKEKTKRQLYSKGMTITQVKDIMGEILKYYIMTRDTDINIDIDDIVGRSRAIQYGSNGYYKKEDFIEYDYDKDKARENARENGFITHSFNSYIKNKVKRNGLRNYKNIDKKLSEDLKYLESKIKRNEFLDNQDSSNANEIYVAAPGQASVHYATNMNPERLYLGPLSQDRETALPIRVGETKKDYLMRVAQKKIIENCKPEEYDKVLKTYRRVINKLGNDSACIALIPTRSQNYDIKIAYSAGKPEERRYCTIEQYYSPMANNGLFFSNSFGNCGQLNDGVTVGDTIPGNEIGIIDVLDEFKIKQIMAKERGLKDGEYIDYFSGEKVENYQLPEKKAGEMIVYKDNPFKRIIQKIKSKFGKRGDLVQNVSEQELESTDNNLNKKEIKSILMSMRTHENDMIVNNLLGKIDIMDEQSIQSTLEKVGNNEEAVRKFFENKLSERTHNQDNKYPINQMFTYGISGNCIHLHLPVDLHEMLDEKGITCTIDTVNLHLLDAITKISDLRDSGFYRFQGKDSIYMISPILIGRERKFLNTMDFKTNLYKKSDLRDEKFIEENSEAKLAASIFGSDVNVGTASINFDIISSEEWKEKRNQKIQEYMEKGITIQGEPQTK